MELLIKNLTDAGLQRGLYTPAQAAVVLKEFAKLFLFENFDVVNQNKDKITPEFIQNKMLKNRRGGLCYELNSLLYLVLKELGFEVSIGIGTVNLEGNWATERTHVIVLLQIAGKKYIADTGFGNRLALYPLELNGGIVHSSAGSFKLRSLKTEKGSIAMEMQNSSGEWEVHYAFNWNPEPWKELDRVKLDIHHRPQSAFNKVPLIATLLKDRTLSINSERLYCKWIDGREEKIVFKTKDDFLKTIRTYCNASITNEAEKFMRKDMFKQTIH